MLFKILVKIIKQYGVKYQFASSPGLGYQDSTFTIKMLLHTRHSHNLRSYVAFVGLVKVFGTVSHEIMFKNYNNMECLPNYVQQ